MLKRLTVIVLHPPNTRLFQFKQCSFPYAPVCLFSALLITPQWWQPMSTCQITFRSLMGAGKEEEIQLSAVSHTGLPLSCFFAHICFSTAFNKIPRHPET